MARKKVACAGSTGIWLHTIGCWCNLVLRVMRDHVLNLPRWNQPPFVSGCNLNLLMGTQVSFEKITFVFSST
jgi:hypothetical protein